MAFPWPAPPASLARQEQRNIASDPNRMDDEQYILRLIGQVITVSLETTKIIGTLPEANPDTGARFTVPLRDWQGALWAVRVAPAAPGSADMPRPVSRLSPGLPTPRRAA